MDGETFKRRLVSLCMKDLPGLPKKEEDRHVLLKSIVLTMNPQKEYSHKELQEILIEWLEGVGRSVGSDHAALRREMVDDGFLTRDPAGTTYKINSQAPVNSAFDETVESIDTVAAVEEGRRLKAEKKRQFMQTKQGKGASG
ncbi:MAG: DUF2087 domain-containing protein [Candidatus Eisenbacteria bacterium]|uniref:DUF2087 domain-containing protein n=1 Tax=Eiseniibacteriota bacterium TaxID=2212470 RepID=A0A948RYA1_UNCEI|nr:DUF2087 domain-containing protein [Candidatus Eisenbacteria bacterium]MBU1948680.1 DUF2087 domain-containing protein [Candidatus Eisenbacteria bacterium]MBU2692661.1 DUF2087 domain-containing protein [Candidatus Eisenbacteria bacterium]